MTSTLLTERWACGADWGTADIEGKGKREKGRGKGESRRVLPFPFTLPPSLKSSAVLVAVARRDAFLLRILRGGLLDHRAHDRLVGGDPVADRVPFLAVPLQKPHRSATFVVHAGHLERLHQADRTEFLETLVVDLKMLDPPAHLLTGERLLAELRLRVADRFGGDDAGDDAPCMVDRADAGLVFHLPLALLVDMLEDVLHHRIAGPG